MKKKKDETTIRSSTAEYLTYVASIGDHQDSIEMHYENENIWLTQKMISTLYDVGISTINEHIKKIYADSELEEATTIRKFRIVQTYSIAQNNSKWFCCAIYYKGDAFSCKASPLATTVHRTVVGNSPLANAF